MRKILLLFLLLSGVLLTACVGQQNSGVIPTADKLTFLFFYTEG
jgi:hypothetical protein